MLRSIGRYADGTHVVRSASVGIKAVTGGAVTVVTVVTVVNDVNAVNSVNAVNAADAVNAVNACAASGPHPLGCI